MLGTFGIEDYEMLVELLLEYLSVGINCLSGSFRIVFIVIRTAISIKLEILQVISSVPLNAFIVCCLFQFYLETILWQEFLEGGECPSGFDIGDWSDGSGECCCDPDHQPEDGGANPPTGEVPILIGGDTTGEVPILIGGETPVPIDGETPVPIDGETPVPIDGETPVPIDGETPVPIDGETPILIEDGLIPYLLGATTSGLEPYLHGSSTPGLEGLIPVLLGGSTPGVEGLVPYLLNGYQPYLLSSSTPETTITEEPPIKTTTPLPTLPPVPIYEPSPTKPPMKYCKCRTKYEPSTQSPSSEEPSDGLIPVLITTEQPSSEGLIPFLLTSSASSEGLIPYLLTSSTEGLIPYFLTSSTDGLIPSLLPDNGGLLPFRLQQCNCDCNCNELEVTEIKH